MGKLKLNFLIPILFFLLSSEAYSQQDSVKYATIKFTYKFGLNTNIIATSEEYKSGFTGWGVFFEPHITPNLSVVLSYNSLKIENKNHLINPANLSSTESNLIIRYRFLNETYSLFPEIGLGGWGNDIYCLLIGVGTDYNLSKKFNTSFSIDYAYAYRNLLGVGGNGWANSFIKMNLSISYQIYKTKKTEIKNE